MSKPSRPNCARPPLRFREAVSKVQELGTTVSGLKEVLKPPKINAAFDVLYSPQPNRSYSSGWLDFYYQPSHFLRLGVEDIGENTQLDAQVGECVSSTGRVLRYGIYRSNLGLGLDMPVRKDWLSVDLFDPNHLQADVLMDFPHLLGPSVDLVAGIRNLNEDNLLVTGVRFQRPE